MASRVSRYDVEKFDGKNNFSMWQVEVKDILVKDGLSEALEGKPQGMKDNEWISFDQQACSTIRLCLSKEIKHNVMTVKSAKEIWEKLEKLYLEKSLTNRINLKKEFYRFTMDESTTLQDHLNEFNRMLSELLNLEVKMSEEDKVAVLLASLPEKYDHLVTTMLYGKQSIVLDEVTSTLLSNENRRKVVDGIYEDSKVLSVRGRRESRDQGWKSSKSTYSGNHRDKECYYCHEKGHIAKNCPKLKKKKDEGNEKDDDSHQRVSATFSSQYDDCVITWEPLILVCCRMMFGYLILVVPFICLPIDIFSPIIKR